MTLPENAFHGIVHPEIRAWLEDRFAEDDPVVAEMEALARTREFPIVGRASGRCLEMLARSIGARRVFEMGSGYGYSAFFFARAVGPGGRVICTEKDAHEHPHFRRFFDGHAFADRIEMHHGDAFEVLSQTAGDLDAIFVDIHKEAYAQALEAAVPRLRPGGLLLVDNALWGGRVARAEARDPATEGVRRFDEALFSDPRLFATILPVGDGLAVGWKRP